MKQKKIHKNTLSSFYAGQPLLGMELALTCGWYPSQISLEKTDFPVAIRYQLYQLQIASWSGRGPSVYIPLSVWRPHLTQAYVGPTHAGCPSLCERHGHQPCVW